MALARAGLRQDAIEDGGVNITGGKRTGRLRRRFQRGGK